MRSRQKEAAADRQRRGLPPAKRGPKPRGGPSAGNLSQSESLACQAVESALSAAAAANAAAVAFTSPTAATAAASGTAVVTSSAAVVTTSAALVPAAAYIDSGSGSGFSIGSASTAGTSTPTIFSKPTAFLPRRGGGHGSVSGKGAGWTRGVGTGDSGSSNIGSIGGGSGDNDIGFYIVQLEAMLRNLTLQQQLLHGQIQSAMVICHQHQLQLQHGSYQAQSAGNQVWFHSCHVRLLELLHAAQAHQNMLQLNWASVTGWLGYVKQNLDALRWLDQQGREFQQTPTLDHGGDTSQPPTILEQALQRVCAIPGITTKPPAGVARTQLRQLGFEGAGMGAGKSQRSVLCVNKHELQLTITHATCRTHVRT